MFAHLLAVVLTSQPALSWKEVDALVEQQKRQQALEAITARLENSRGGSDEDEYTKALLRSFALREQLEGRESALEALRAEAWPKALPARTLVQLAWVEGALRYLEWSQYELSARERISSEKPLALKQMTADQVRAEILKVAAALWANREQLGALPNTALGDALTPNTFPPGLKDTLRDLVSERMASMLARLQFWSADEQFNLFTLNAPALIRGETSRVKPLTLTDESVHPLIRAAAVLDDLEQWHLQTNRLESALWARVARTELLSTHFTSETSRKAFIAQLQIRVEAASKAPFSAYGRAEMATQWQRLGDLAKARDVAAVGAKAFPQSVGGQRCASLVAALEAPEFDLNGNQFDGVGKRSLQVHAKNLPTLYFRARRLGFDEVRGVVGQESVLPSGVKLEKLLKGAKPVSWQVDLPATPDLQAHSTAITPPLTQQGIWFIEASARADFAMENNRILRVSQVVSDLSVIHRRRGHIDEVLVLNAETGAPVAKASVELWRFSWDKVASISATGTTDVSGAVSLKRSNGDFDYFAIAKHGDSVTIDVEGGGGWWDSPPQKQDEVLIYTDRAIYRPNQVVKWKVIAFRHGERGPEKLLAGDSFDVELIDANGQQVLKRKVKTNQFGSASGEFVLPTGKALGAWWLKALDSNAQIRVEEYKRPTFELTFREPAGALKLNAPVTLTADARYYFGLPVTAGKVKWVVKRSPN